LERSDNRKTALNKNMPLNQDKVRRREHDAELLAMHASVRDYCREHACGPRTEAYRLLATLGCIIGNRVLKERTLEQCRQRYGKLLEPTWAERDAAAHMAAIGRE
jgi:hypothetical protein